MLKKWIAKHSKTLQSNIIASTGDARQQQLRGRWQDARYIALDLETDGLDPAQDAILAFGWVPLAPPRIRLFEAGYGVVKSDKSLSQSAVIHHLSEDDIRGGEPIERILKRMAPHLDGAVLIAHHAPFDWKFLHQAFKHHQIECQPLALMDTLKIERNRLARKKNWLEQGELTLGTCRERYDLPAMRQHHALSDAIASAELFLAQAYQIAGSHRVSLREMLRYA